MMVHVQKGHHTNTDSEPKDFKCQVCEKSFLRKAALAVHSQVHNDESPFICEVCGQKFKRKSNLNKHLEAKHNENKIQ